MKSKRVCMHINMSDAQTFDTAMEIPYLYANPGNAAAYIDMRKAGDTTSDEDMWRAASACKLPCSVGSAWLHFIYTRICSYNVQDMIDHVHALVDFSSPTKTSLLEPT